MFIYWLCVCLFLQQQQSLGTASRTSCTNFLRHTLGTVFRPATNQPRNVNKQMFFSPFFLTFALNQQWKFFISLHFFNYYCSTTLYSLSVLLWFQTNYRIMIIMLGFCLYGNKCSLMCDLGSNHLKRAKSQCFAKSQ